MFSVVYLTVYFHFYTDICYLTLKWLRGEIEKRILDNNEKSLLIRDDNEPYFKYRCR
jgi:hypothetical protein